MGRGERLSQKKKDRACSSPLFNGGGVSNLSSGVKRKTSTFAAVVKK